MKDVNPQAIRILSDAQDLQDNGHHKAAEAAYIRGIEAIGSGQQELCGTLYLNLGNNALADERDDDALGFYRRAVEFLQGLRGEAILQCAHAYFNIARIHLGNSDPQGVECSKQALERYLQHPFSSPVDVADALALNVVIGAALGQLVQQADVVAAWEAMLAVPFEELQQPIILDCLRIIMTVAADGGMPQSLDEIRQQVRRWSGFDTLT